MVDGLLTSLENKGRWETAFYTFGSNHSSLIGLLVDWWIYNGDQREVLEAPPWSASKKEKGQPCDAILIEKGICKGIVEVEGSNYINAIDRMVKYIVPGNGFWQLEFGIFLAYPTKRAHMEKPLPIDHFVEKGRVVTKEHQIQLIILTLDKKWDPQTEGPRVRGPRGQNNYRHDYYNGKPCRLTGVLIEGGEEITKRRVFREV